MVSFTRVLHRAAPLLPLCGPRRPGGPLPDRRILAGDQPGQWNMINEIDFDGTAVPEPSSLALLGIGWIGDAPASSPRLSETPQLSFDQQDRPSQDGPVGN